MNIFSIGDESKKSNENHNQSYGNFENEKTPSRKKEKEMECWRKRITYIFFFVLFLYFIIKYYLKFNSESTLLGLETSLLDKIIDEKIVATLLGVFVALITFYNNEKSKAAIKAKEEENKKKLYMSEIKDLIRHLKANLKVLLQINNEMKNTKIPAEIHFTNLAWPEKSILFSDEIINIVESKYVNDFSRIKVKLRNMQNSSVWLASYMKEDHTKTEIKEVLTWEIKRQFKYLVTFIYLDAHNYHFSDDEKIKNFINTKNEDNQSIRDNLIKEFTKSDVDKYLDLNNPNKPRHVLFRNKAYSSS